MRLVAADTGPVNYLILIGSIKLLPAMFGTVLLPAAVEAELKATDAPTPVLQWITRPPAWLEIRNDELPPFDPALDALDAGEKAAIALAGALRADLLLLDGHAGVRVARKKGFRVTALSASSILRRNADWSISLKLSNNSSAPAFLVVYFCRFALLAISVALFGLGAGSVSPT